MQTGLERIAEKARKETKRVFTSLTHHLTKELIWESLCHIPKGSAPGVDGQSVDNAKENFGNWTVSEGVHTFCKDAIPRRTVNQLLKRPVREICRRASVRAAHREVRGYSTAGGRFPCATHLFTDYRVSCYPASLRALSVLICNSFLETGIYDQASLFPTSLFRGLNYPVLALSESFYFQE